MAKKNDATIGQRIARYRRAAGFRTSEDLATAIPNPKLTSSVLRNIESGRMVSITVAQLLDISKALDLSPTFLLAPLENPLARVDLENVGSAIANMKSFEIEAWISGTSMSETPAGSAAHRILLEMRNLTSTVPRYRESIALHLSLAAQGRSGNDPLISPRDPGILWPGGSSFYGTRIITSAAKYLTKAGVDVSWAQDVIDDANRHMQAERQDDIVELG